MDYNGNRISSWIWFVVLFVPKKVNLHRVPVLWMISNEIVTAAQEVSFAIREAYKSPKNTLSPAKANNLVTEQRATEPGVMPVTHAPQSGKQVSK